MAFLHEEEDDHHNTNERKEYGAEDRYSSEPQKVHLTGEFVIVALFYVLYLGLVTSKQFDKGIFRSVICL